MRSRPLSVSIIAWFLIVTACLNLILMTVTIGSPQVREILSKSPVPVPIQIALAYVGLAVTLVSGIGMLRGKNWSRWLYVGWTAFGSILGVATSPMKLAMIPGIIVFGVIVFFLFRPAANRFFSDRPLS